MILASSSSSKRALRLSLLSLISGLLLCASSAFAEDAEIRTAARDLATQGAQAFDAGDYAQASDFFRRAHELVPAPSIALLRARSLAKLGQLLEAIDIYEQTSRLKLAEDAPEAYVQAVETARNELEEVRRRLPRLKLTLIGVSATEPAQVSMDDKPTPDALLGVERPINPGATSHRSARGGPTARDAPAEPGRRRELSGGTRPSAGTSAGADRRGAAGGQRAVHVERALLAKNRRLRRSRRGCLGPRRRNLHRASGAASQVGAGLRMPPELSAIVC